MILILIIIILISNSSMSMHASMTRHPCPLHMPTKAVVLTGLACLASVRDLTRAFSGCSAAHNSSSQQRLTTAAHNSGSQQRLTSAAHISGSKQRLKTAAQNSGSKRQRQRSIARPCHCQPIATAT